MPSIFLLRESKDPVHYRFGDVYTVRYDAM